MNFEKHDSRCNKCKSVIYKFLFEIFHELEFKYKSDKVSTQLEDYKGTQAYKPLSRIYKALQEINGHESFVNSKNLQRCDLFLPSKKIVIETDEIQHFTYPRYIALKNYPKEFKTGYDITWYYSECNRIKSYDSDPIYRDEQRAWYDTLRDFLPILTGDVKRTVRIPLGFHAWCKLDPTINKDNLIFRNYFNKLVK